MRVRHVELVLLAAAWGCVVDGHVRSHFSQLLGAGDGGKEFTPAPAVQASCGAGERCVPAVQCPALVAAARPAAPCARGVCCPPPKAPAKSARAAAVTPAQVSRAAAAAQRRAAELLERDVHHVATSEAGSPAAGHARLHRAPRPAERARIQQRARQALHVALATRALRDATGLQVEEAEALELPAGPLEAACLPPPHCEPSAPFRRLDGACNNPSDGALGAALSPYARLLPPGYADGVWAPRMSRAHGQPLPSPRLLTTALFTNADRPDREHTLMLMQFGQFLSHDISRSMTTRHPNGSDIACCAPDGLHELPEEDRHYACMPITVSPQDAFYRRYGQRCMNFVRSVLAPRRQCSLGYSQQMNRVSHFLDGSAVYGSDEEALLELREWSGGRLRMLHDYGRQLLPLTSDPEACLTMEQGSACFTAGDDRCNQMVALVAVHTLFAREHNRLANELSTLNPHWNDELLFQESRRILVAELQHIVYSQWLPEVIGHRAVIDFSLSVEHSGYSTDYDPKVDGSITNEFTTAAMRFGHSIVDGRMKMYGHKGVDEIIDITEVMFYPARMRYREFFDEVLTTLTVESPQMTDTSVADALTKYLFRSGNPFGLDLIALNIQRGRDHGLRPYNDYRELVGLHRYYHFEDFGHEAAQALQGLYASPEDVDLYVGGLMEAHAPGAIVGPIFQSIIADQFSRLRKGDKYFYDLHPNINPGHFTPEQLREVKKSTLSRIICDNRDGILLMRQATNAFRKPGLQGNDLIDCNSPMLPRINLVHWQEKL